MYCCSAAQVESLGLQGRIIMFAVTLHLSLGVTGPALRNCVASRVV